MKTVIYAASNARPSGRGDSFVRGIRDVLRRIDAGLLAAVDVSLMWHRRISDRNALRTMDERLLKDIGLSQADVENEAAKPFWRN
jgi:uncharacterized protein YjiS (DUF1127 family)